MNKVIKIAECPNCGYVIKNPTDDMYIYGNEYKFVADGETKYFRDAHIYCPDCGDEMFHRNST